MAFRVILKSKPVQAVTWWFNWVSIAEIIKKVNELKAQLAEAEAKKQAVVDKAEKLEVALNLANRLVNGLADENVRWR